MDINQAIDEYNTSAKSPDINQAIDAFGSSESSQINSALDAQSGASSKPVMPMEKPEFLKKVEIILSGAAKGSLNYTARLMNFLGSLEESDSYVGQPETESPVSRAYGHWTEKNAADKAKYKDAGLYQGIGEVGAELLTTAPVGGVLGAVGKGAEAIGALAPKFNKAAEYAATAIGSAGVLAGMEGGRYNPEKPNEAYSLEQVGDTLQNPLSYALPVAGKYLGDKAANWANRSASLEEAKKIIPSIRMREVSSSPNTATKLSRAMFDPLTNLMGGNRRLDGIGDDISKYINELSGNITAKHAIDYKTIGAQQFRKTLTSLKEGQDEMWNKPFKTAPISNPQEIKDKAIEALDILHNSGIPTADKSRDLITKGLQKETLTANDVKNIASDIGDAVGAAYSMKVGTATKMGTDLAKVRSDLIEKIQANLSGEDLQDFNTAREYSSKYFRTLDISPKIEKALHSDLDSRKFINSMVSEADTIDKTKALGIMGNVEQKAMVATKLAKALETAGQNKPGAVDLSSFINATGEQTSLKGLMGEGYEAVKGLNGYLTNIHNASERKIPMAAGAAGLTLGGLGAYTGVGAIPAAVAAASFGALALIANHSPLKSALGRLGRGQAEGSNRKKLSDSTYKYLSGKVGQMLTRGEFFMTDDGTLDVKEPPKKKSSRPVNNTYEGEPVSTMGISG